MNVRELIAACIDVYKSYRPSVMTIDTHAEEWLDTHDITEEGDRVFVHEVFYGLVRYKKLIRVVISSFFYNHAHEASRLDQDVYMVFCFLAALRLKELTWGEFARFVRGFDPLRLHVFLSFLFNERNIKTYFRDEWLKLYGPDYVDNELVANLLEFLPQAVELTERLHEQVVGPAMANEAAVSDYKGTAESRSTPQGRNGAASLRKSGNVTSGSMTQRERGTHGGRATQPRPFNLTKPAITKVPEPEAIPVNYKARSVPPSTYVEDNDLDDRLEEKRRDFKEGRRKEYSQEGFSFLNRERPSRASLRSAGGAQTSREGGVDMDGRPMEKRKKGNIPSFDNPPPVKLTAAAILREDALYRKRQEEEARMLQAYERELRDPAEFYKWQDRMKAEDEAKQAALMEKRKLEVLLSAEEIALAKMQAEAEKKRIANEVREEKTVLRRRALRNKQAELDSAREKVEFVQKDIRGEARRKKQELMEANKLKAAQMAEERRVAEIEKQRLLEQRRAEKAEQIREIRAMEEVPKQKVNVFDPTTTAGHNLLSEMSLAEAKEKHQLNIQREQTRVDEKRAELLNERALRDAKIVAKMNAIARYRGAVDREAEARASRVRDAKIEAEQALQGKQDDDLIRLQEKLAAKRQQRFEERKRLEQDQRRLQIRAQLLEGDAAALEEKKYLQLERGGERIALEKQRRRQAERAVGKQARMRETVSKVNYAAMTQKQQLKAEREYNAREKLAKLEARERLESDKKRIESVVAVEKERYRKQMERQNLQRATNKAKPPPPSRDGPGFRKARPSA